MFTVAQLFGISESDLIAAHPHITDPNNISPGDVLCVPGFRKPESCPPGFGGRYEVQEGDTMFSVARKFNISVDELSAANPHIPDPDRVYPFDVLCVPEND